MLCLLVGYPFAYYIARKPPEVASRLIMLIMIPFWTNSLMRLNAWMLLFQANGPVNHALMALGLMGNNFLGPVILMVVATTIVTPILLKFVFRWGPANTPPVEKGFSETYAQLGALRSGIGVKEMAEKARQAAAQQKK